MLCQLVCRIDYRLRIIYKLMLLRYIRPIGRLNYLQSLTKKRSLFDKTTYNPEWLPKVTSYSKNRKPRMAIWSDPDEVVPYQIPRLHAYSHPRSYLKNIVEEEERNKSLRSKQFILQDIRAGDIIEITYQETFQVDDTVTYRCYVLSFKRRNSLTASLQVLIRLAGVNLKVIYPVHSPKVRNIKLVSKGSGNFQSNLKNKWMTMPKHQTSKPRIRNRVIKLREGAKRRQKKLKEGSIIYDQVLSDNVKNII